MHYSSQQFSPKVYELASTYRLGAPAAAYRWTLTLLEFFWMTLAGVWLVLIILTLRSVFAPNSSGMGPEGFIFVFVILLLCVGYFVECFRRLFSWRVYVFADGFIYLKYGKPDVFRWEDVYALRQRIQGYIGNARPSFYVYYVERSDGHTVVFNNHIKWIVDLGNTLNQRITATMLPEIFQEYNQGKVIGFGPLDIGQAGISKEYSHLPWSQVDDILMRNGYVSIYAKGNKPSRWATLPVHKIPNVLVFMTLAREALKNQGA